MSKWKLKSLINIFSKFYPTPYLSTCAKARTVNGHAYVCSDSVFFFFIILFIYSFLSLSLSVENTVFLLKNKGRVLQCGIRSQNLLYNVYTVTKYLAKIATSFMFLVFLSMCCYFVKNK